MALTDDNGMNTTMLVSPTGGMPFGNAGGNGLFGNGDSWLGILFLIALCNGGFGGFGGFGGGYGAMMMNGGMLGYDFPWLMAGQQNINANTNSGFRDAMINDGITSVRDGISALSTQLCGCCGDMQMNMANGFNTVNLGIANGTSAIQNSLCNGFNGVNVGISNAQNALAQQMYANQIADLERSYAAQTANTAGIASLATQTQDLKYTVASENCADRTQAMQNTRDIIDSQTRSTQAILDKLCQLELDGVKAQVDAKNDRIAELQTQLNMAALNASQVAQTAELRTANANQLNNLVSELRSCPIPAQPVYGNQPIFTCSPSANSNVGCGCGSF